MEVFATFPSMSLLFIWFSTLKSDDLVNWSTEFVIQNLNPLNFLKLYSNLPSPRLNIDWTSNIIVHSMPSIYIVLPRISKQHSCPLPVMLSIVGEWLMESNWHFDQWFFRHGSAAALLQCYIPTESQWSTKVLKVQISLDSRPQIFFLKKTIDSDFESISIGGLDLRWKYDVQLFPAKKLFSDWLTC